MSFDTPPSSPTRTLSSAAEPPRSPEEVVCDLIDAQLAEAEVAYTALAGVDKDSAVVLAKFTSTSEAVRHKRLLPISPEKESLHSKGLAFHSRLMTNPIKSNEGAKEPGMWEHYLKEILPYVEDSFLEVATNLCTLIMEIAGADAESIATCHLEVVWMCRWLQQSNSLLNLDIRHLVGAAVHLGTSCIRRVANIGAINEVLEGKAHPNTKVLKYIFTSSVATFLLINLNDILSLCQRMNRDCRTMYSVVAF
jgi:hypothetical protein